MASKVQTRVLYGAAMIAALAALIYLDWWLEETLGTHGGLEAMCRSALYCLPTAVVLLSLMLVAFAELSRMARSAGIRLLGISGVIATVLLATLGYWSRFLLPLFERMGVSALPFPLVVIVFVAVFLEQMIRYRLNSALPQIGCTLLAIIYLGVFGGVIFGLRVTGVEYLVLFLAAVKFTDIGAYFTGTAIGKHKMIPWLSPGKTWEGLAGGLVCGIAVSLLITKLFGIDDLGVWETIIFAAAVGLTGQFGDLCESLLKRSASVKDSGAVVPEFGGVMDIIDSPLVAAPVGLFLLTIMR